MIAQKGMKSQFDAVAAMLTIPGTFDSIAALIYSSAGGREDSMMQVMERQRPTPAYTGPILAMAAPDSAKRRYKAETYAVLCRTGVAPKED